MSYNESEGFFCQSTLHRTREDTDGDRDMTLIYLEKRVPERNQQRYYTIQVVPTLFGVWTVQREWGRIGHPGTVRETGYATEQEALTAGQQWRQRKEQRGYRIIVASGALKNPESSQIRRGQPVALAETD